MKITRVEAVGLSTRSERNVADGTQDALLLLVHTDEGLVGIGEADTSPQIGKAVLEAPVSGDKCQGLAMQLVGEDPFDLEALWKKCFYRSYKYGRMGVALNVMSGLDMALWDLIGKATGRPLYQLLGGAVRKKAPAYASVLFPEAAEDLEDVRQKARLAVERGFLGIKYGWGSYGYDTRKDYAMVAAAREVLGPDVALMIDVGMRWDIQTGIERIGSLQPLNPYWFEEPCYAEEYETYAALAEFAPWTRIVGGEQEYNRWGFRRLMECGKVKGIQPDLARNGGITETKKAAAIAQERGVPVFPHGWSTNVLVAANLHFIAATPNCSWCEYNVGDSPLRWDLTHEQFPVVDGYVAVPEGPGLGITLNWDTIERYRVL
jgi:L-alanine-DL-glutamate epimerase-like enolase superfamily enzyme